MPNIISFKTLDKEGFLEFSVSNAKYLAFDTLDGNALITTKAIQAKITFVDSTSLIQIQLH